MAEVSEDRGSVQMPRTQLTGRFDRALTYAVDLHRDQPRKGSLVPYVGHLLGTAGLVLHFGGDEEQAMAALLHDAAEDRGGRARLEDIRLHFGDRVARIVEGCTDTFAEKKPPWRPRKTQYIAHLKGAPADVKLVSAADKLDNARAIVADLRAYGPSVWDRFTATGEETLWYYGELVEAFREGWKAPVVDELEWTVGEMKRLAGARP